MTYSSQFKVTVDTWQNQAAHAQPIRCAVFVEEQGVPLALEWDEWDAVSWHAIAWWQGTAIGTGRLLPDGHLGRMAVLLDWRSQGVGSLLLTALIKIAEQQNLAQVILHAQVSAIEFYRKHHFVPEGPVFMEAGIPHQCMRYVIPQPSQQLKTIGVPLK